MGYNFRYMIASDTVLNSAGGYRVQGIGFKLSKENIVEIECL